MPINRANSRTFHRRLYAGMLEKVIVYKRDPLLQAGTVHKYCLFDVRPSQIQKSGEQLGGTDGSMGAKEYRVFHVPRIEMDRVGIQFFNAGDVFEDKEGRQWATLAPETIRTKLLQQHVCVETERLK